jgi:hypothetical protein
VWDGDAEALEAKLGRAESPEEPLEVIDEQRDVHAVKANVLEGGVVDKGAAAVADGVAYDPKQLGSLALSLEVVKHFQLTYGGLSGCRGLLWAESRKGEEASKLV